MERISRHKVLAAGDSFSQCSDQVHRFFELTTLVIYDYIEIREQHSVSGLDGDFFPQLKLAEERNHQLVRGLIDELRQAGINTTTDLQNIEQGYLSKTFHILSHFLDGFIGIDSYFYNLPDDSHWLSNDKEAAIKADPGHYWLLHLDCFSISPEEACVLHRPRET